MSVAPRWKRRADEIAEAIGDELSVNGTVSIGNDVSLSVATITALANAITSVLNPTSIAAAIWLGQEVGTHVATVVAPVAPLTARQYSITLDGVYQITRSHVYTYDLSSQISANDYTVGTVLNVLLTSGTTNMYRLLNPNALTHNVNVVSTSTTPVHVQVRNIAGGFTAMGSDISTSMKLSAQPVSIADTVDVKTATGEAVAITGTVNANVGGVTVPISNPNNITVPVVNSNSVTVPVSLGSVTVPVKATAAGIPQNANGISLYLPVDANHGLTIPVGGGVTSIPVANTNSVTVAVSGGTTSIPISGGTASVPVANTNGVTVQISGGTASVPVANTNSVVVPVENTNNVTIPVTASGTVLDVNIATVAASAKTQFHEAMETALEEADVVDVNIATIASAAQTDLGLGMRGIVQNSLNTSTLNTWRIFVDDGTVTSYDQSLHDTSGTNLPGNRRDDMLGRAVYRTTTSYIWRLVVDTTVSDEGIILSGIASTTDYYTWHVVRNGATFSQQRLFETPDSAPYYIMCSSNSVRDSYIGKKVTLYSDDTWLVHA